MLFTMLPNLQSMTTVGMCYDFEPITERVWAIVEGNRGSES